MDIDKDQFEINLLRGWQRSQLKLLKEFTVQTFVSQTILSVASGSRVGTHELGGKLTALTRADLIQKAGKDDDGNWVWQLNEKKVDRESLKEFLKSLGIE